MAGSPPHARGRHRVAPRRTRQGRITPACAGKTTAPPSRRRGLRDHPRMRGEDVELGVNPLLDSGSPPHARGRRPPWLRPVQSPGITPACAGKTNYLASNAHQIADHPRMRGEDYALTDPTTAATGSPPHARGRRGVRDLEGDRPRITPACAGKTRLRSSRGQKPSDHPRMRGEDSRMSISAK